MIDIVEVIKPYVPLNKRGFRYIACCPFHEDKIRSFIVDSVKQNYSCFSCGAVGDAVKFIMTIESMNYQEALQYLLLKNHSLWTQSN